ncbi:hypothetical protein [Streptomyces sp. NPDC048737]|uniref:hypothetical protein n=1 Tax=unclassified Streptomyces TaxID=2593676 RepID=UPI00341559BF
MLQAGPQALQDTRKQRHVRLVGLGGGSPLGVPLPEQFAPRGLGAQDFGADIRQCQIGFRPQPYEVGGRQAQDAED